MLLSSSAGVRRRREALPARRGARLALKVAHAVYEAYPDGIWLI